MKERAISHQHVKLALELKEKHIKVYSGARVEIERLIQIAVQEPQRMLSISTDGMDNKKVSLP